MRNTFELFDDEAAGYTIKPLRVGTFRMLCHATINCDNLRRAFLRMITYFKLLSDEFDWSLEERGEEAVLTFNNAPNLVVENGYFTATMMILLWRWASWLIDSPILLSRVYLDFSHEPVTDNLNDFFKTTVYFNQSKNQLVMPSHYLERPVKQDNQSLIPFLIKSPECLLSNYRSDSSISLQVKIYLEQVDEADTITLDLVANSFQLSGQTLARRLKKEGHQFQELKDKVRKNRAIKLLRSNFTMAEISQQLGFSEDSVFYRTFKKWTGVTPTEYRKKKQID